MDTMSMPAGRRRAAPHGVHPELLASLAEPAGGVIV
jgi:hypothetical protein